MATHTVRLAKFDEADFDATNDFLSALDSIFDNRWFCSNEEQWKEWDDDDPDKTLMLRIQHELGFEESCDPDDVDNRLIIYEFVKRKFRACECGWRSVIMAADILVRAACDPMVDTVEWHPMIERMLEDVMLGE